jgi:hypothetical protein
VSLRLRRAAAQAATKIGHDVFPSLARVWHFLLGWPDIAVEVAVPPCRESQPCATKGEALDMLPFVHHVAVNYWSPMRAASRGTTC